MHSMPFNWRESKCQKRTYAEGCGARTLWMAPYSPLSNHRGVLINRGSEVHLKFVNFREGGSKLKWVNICKT